MPAQTGLTKPMLPDSVLRSAPVRAYEDGA